jgi:hypothetical protein
MKLFSVILSVYIFSLAAIPCIDQAINNTFHKIEITTFDVDKHLHNHDHCSPFCTCYCCASRIFDQVLYVYFSDFSIIRKKLFGYTSGYDLSIYASIWQPPKIMLVPSIK